ncbi:septum formation initiator family protein [Candidatus Palauibacter sp.]|uniref:septum formation initiator family protein n=1 Tax=Candidatus Palauibacter sp. TaxID=3101350 RepID=UPI003B59322C
MAEAANRRLSRIIAFVALVAAGYYWMVGGEYTRAGVSRLEEETRSREAEIAAREAALAALDAWADSLVAHPWAIERVARERYGFVRPGEILLRFVELGDEARPGTELATRPEEPASR